IWTTRGEGDPYFTWEFYIDGEETPSICATDEELRRAMEAYPVPLAVANSVPFGNRDFNFFLPIPFEKSIRVNVVQRVDAFWLWFCQIDYRLGDDELSGTRMIGPNENEPNIRYVGLSKQRRTFSEDQPQHIEQQFRQTTIAPGETARVASLDGPAIVRELRLQWPQDANAQLLVRYDGEKSYAIESPINKYFGTFQGASFYQHAPNDSSCYLPMPFRKQCEIFVRNNGGAPIQITGKANVERVHSFSPSWAYLHAKYQKTDKTDGHHLHQVIYIRGRGHFLGMTLYNTGHDHGGGDFAVVDGEGAQPAFLHGVNGEDYFTFAWFGRGAHHPYAVARSNEEGRYRHHFENPYP
ncbi:DUF2961 domain-containing protein, partial [bacterium]|nr:DUF2961 domain-containing protein [bacterium]